MFEPAGPAAPLTVARPTAEALIRRLDRLPFTAWHRRFLIVSALGVMFDAVDFALFGAALPLIAVEFGLSAQEAGGLATVGLVGAFLGALFWGSVSDHVGRKLSIQSTIGIFAAFTGLMALSWNVVSLGVFRLLANFGLGGEIPVNAALSAEFMPDRLRGRTTALSAAAFPLGLIVAALLGLLIVPHFGWRLLFAVGVLPAVLLFAVRRHIPESVRYLAGRGRLEEARAIVETIEAAVPHSATVRDGTAAISPPQPTVARHRATPAELVAPARRRLTLLLWVVSFCFLWANNGIIFMLPTILTHAGMALDQALTMSLLLAVGGLLGFLAFGPLVDRFGRRPVLFAGYFCGAFFSLAFALSSGAWMYITVAMVGLVNPGIFGITSLYVSELYPTRMRATAIGWFYGIGRIGSFLAPVAFGVMLSGGLAPYVLHTTAVAFLVASVAILTIGVETKGRSLESIAR